MNPIIRNVLAVIIGAVAGGLVNMGIIMISGSVIPAPEGVDVSDIESIKANMHLYQPIHFVMPFLAHALGTLAGAFIAALLAARQKIRIGITVGVFFLVGGLSAIYMLPAPMWFNVLDAVVAYIPMGWLGAVLALKFQGGK